MVLQGQLESRGVGNGKQEQKIVEKVACVETRQLEAPRDLVYIQTLLGLTQSSMEILFTVVSFHTY